MVGKGLGSGLGGSEKYYGNGTVAVWSFVTGALQVRLLFSNIYLVFASHTDSHSDMRRQRNTLTQTDPPTPTHADRQTPQTDRQTDR